jgi:hypothetical protein
MLMHSLTRHTSACTALLGNTSVLNVSRTKNGYFMKLNRRPLTDKQISILTLVLPSGASVAVGLEDWQDLYYRGLLQINRRQRYEITDEGRAALNLLTAETHL